MNSNPICHPSPAKKWNAHFWIMFTSDEQPGWSMDSNPICHPSPANKMKYSFLDYVQLLMISWAGRWTQTPFTTHLQPENEMLIFWLCSTSDDQLHWSMDLIPICQPSPAKTVKCSFLYYIQHVMLARLVNGLEPHPPSLSSQKNEMLLFGLCSSSDD